LDNAIRLYLDENVETAIATQLRARGIEVVTVDELNLKGDSDENHLQRATEMGYVLCTYDMDYTRLHAKGIEHAGIVFAKKRDTTLGDWIRGLELICSVLMPDDMKNHIEYL
jgi:hypothetical protein